MLGLENPPSNPRKGDHAIPLSDGSWIVMAFTVRAYAELETKYGSLSDLEDRLGQPLTTDLLCDCFRVGLRRHHADIAEDQDRLDDIFMDLGIVGAGLALEAAVNVGFLRPPEGEGAQEGDPRGK